MTVPDQFPRHMSRAASVTVADPANVSGDPADGSPPPVAVRPWREEP